LELNYTKTRVKGLPPTLNYIQEGLRAGPSWPLAPHITQEPLGEAEGLLNRRKKSESRGRIPTGVSWRIERVREGLYTLVPLSLLRLRMLLG
jgi:hypothetical protein